MTTDLKILCIRLRRGTDNDYVDPNKVIIRTSPEADTIVYSLSRASQTVKQSNKSNKSNSRTAKVGFSQETIWDQALVNKIGNHENSLSERLAGSGFLSIYIYIYIYLCIY